MRRNVATNEKIEISDTGALWRHVRHVLSEGVGRKKSKVFVHSRQVSTISVVSIIAMPILMSTLYLEYNIDF